MPTRKYHRKSKTGCTACKERRVKCDEHYPTCRGCIRTGSKCSLQASVPASEVGSDEYPVGLRSRSPDISGVVADGTTTPSSHPRAEYVVPDPRGTQPDSSESISSRRLPSIADLTNDGTFLRSGLSSTGPVNVIDLELMHYFSMVTWRTFAVRPELDELWQNIAVQLAFSNPPLMHNILAVAGHHMMCQKYGPEHMDFASCTRTDLKARVTFHQTSAVRLTMQEIANAGHLDDDKCEALFLACAILPTLTLASYQSLTAHNMSGSDSSVDRAVEFFRLLRGLAALITDPGSNIGKGRLRILLTVLDVNTPVSLDVETSNALTVLLEEVAAASPEQAAPVHVTNDQAQKPQTPQHAFDANRHLISQVQNMFIALTVRPENAGQVMGCFTSSGLDHLTTTLPVRDPASLAILAHWAVGLDRVKSSWWELGLGRRIVQEIVYLLNGNLSRCMQWPVAQVGLGP